MARKTEKVSVPAEWSDSRDRGKVYLLTEMPSEKSEKWAMRMMVALKGTQGEVPPEIMSMGMVAIAWRGLNAFLAAEVNPDTIEPLMDEMMTCVRIIRDPRAQPDLATDIVPGADDIEEVKTRLWLRSKIVELHTGFSPAESLSKLISAVPAPQA